MKLINDLARIEEALNRQSSQQRILAKLNPAPGHHLCTIRFQVQIPFQAAEPAMDSGNFSRLSQEIEKFWTIRRGRSSIREAKSCLRWMDKECLASCALKKLDVDQYELCKMAVEKRARCKGIGRMLMAAAIDLARDRGATELVLETSSKLVAAIKLYEKFGFERVPLSEHTDYARTDTAMRLIIDS